MHATRTRARATMNTPCLPITHTHTHTHTIQVIAKVDAMAFRPTLSYRRARAHTHTHTHTHIIQVLAQVDATALRDLAKSYGVSSFPTLKIFHEGVFAEEYEGE